MRLLPKSLRRLSLRALLCWLPAALAACNPLYVIQAGITQSEILYNRRDIDDVLADPATPPEISKKLLLVTDVRKYALELGLEPGGTFQSYSALDRDTLAWIVLAAQPDSFTFYKWWFPIVGSVPYKGYFTPEAAQKMAKELQDEGYETLVRGTEAFSTLGWFDDPVMTPMLRNQDHHVATTVIHEILHTTVWLPGKVTFNESLANFVGHQGAINYYQHRVKTCPQPCPPEVTAELAAAEQGLIQALDISRTLGDLVPDLRQLYESAKTREEKIAEREVVFARHIAPLRQRIPELRILKRAHNAELMQLQLYYSKLDLFRELWNTLGSDWKLLIEQIRDIVKASKKEDRDPFDLLSERLSKAPSDESQALADPD